MNLAYNVQQIGEMFSVTAVWLGSALTDQAWAAVDPFTKQVLSWECDGMMRSG